MPIAATASIRTIRQQLPSGSLGWRTFCACGTSYGALLGTLLYLEMPERIDRLVTDLQEAQRLGENGRKAILAQYNWAHEEQALQDLYESLGPATPASEFV